MCLFFNHRALLYLTASQTAVWDCATEQACSTTFLMMGRTGGGGAAPFVPLRRAAHSFQAQPVPRMHFLFPCFMVEMSFLHSGFSAEHGRTSPCELAAQLAFYDRALIFSAWEMSGS